MDTSRFVWSTFSDPLKDNVTLKEEFSWDFYREIDWKPAVRNANKNKWVFAAKVWKGSIPW